MAATTRGPVKGVHSGGAAWMQLHASIGAYGLDLLTQRGYGGFTVDALAAFSGINRRTIYRHYPSRIDLAIAAIRQMPAFDPAWDVQGSPRDRLRQATHTISMLPLRLPQLLATAVTHANDAPELLQAVLDNVMRPRLEFLNRVLDEGKADGWVRPTSQAWEVSALINGLMINEALDLAPFPSRTARADALSEAIWRLVASDADSDGTLKPAGRRAR